MPALFLGILRFFRVEIMMANTQHDLARIELYNEKRRVGYMSSIDIYTKSDVTFNNCVLIVEGLWSSDHVNNYEFLSNGAHYMLAVVFDEFYLIGKFRVHQNDKNGGGTLWLNVEDGAKFRWYIGVMGKGKGLHANEMFISKEALKRAGNAKRARRL